MKPVSAVLLDRDGDLNQALIVDGRPFPPHSLTQLRIEPGAGEGRRALKRAGYNLPELVVCPHSDEDHCDCRKPKPGMTVAAALRHGVELPSSYMIGDRWRDVEAARAAECFTIFLDRGYSERRPETMNFVCADLCRASRHILSRRRRGPEERSRS